MKRLTRRDWAIVQLVLSLGMFLLVLGSVMVPQASHEPTPMPYRPATAEELHQYEVDHLAEMLQMQQNR